MRLKKGFTLAEILIVLMVIGVIATMTIPSMMKGVTEAQLKAGYKKAYNTISNFAAMENVAGNWPGRRNEVNLGNLYKSLNSSLSIKGYALHPVNGATLLSNNPANNSGCVRATTNIGVEDIGAGTNACLAIHTAEGNLGQMANGTGNVVWAITEDNIAYTILGGGHADANTNCATKLEIASQADDANAYNRSCYIFVVDVDGLTKGKNSYEPQGLIDTTSSTGEDVTAALPQGQVMNTLANDQYKIYAGSDGVTAGPRVTTATGRIIADLK